MGGLRPTYANQAVDIVNLAKSVTITCEGFSQSSPQVPNRPLPDPISNSDTALAWTPNLIPISFPTRDTIVNFTVDETINNILAVWQKHKRRHSPSSSFPPILRR